MKKQEITRREFLKGSAATAAAAGLANMGFFSSASADELGDKKIKAAIIGTGNQGTYLLRRAVKVPNVEWVACCDIQEKNLKYGLSIAKGAKGYDDYRKIIDDKSIDAVVIATPITLHAPMTIEALNSGKHVLCEKMMAYDIEGAKNMFRTAQKVGKKLQLGHQRRYNPDYQHAYKMIQDGIIGKVTHVRAQWNRNASWRRPAPPELEELINWRLYKKLSRGLMAELGSHQVDVVNWVLGETPTAVVGIGGLDYYKDGRDIYDNVQVIYEYANGVKFQYQSICTNQFDGFTEQIMGDKGTIILSPSKVTMFPEPKADEIIWAEMADKETSGGKEGLVLAAEKSPRKKKEMQEGKAIGADGHAKKDDYLLELEDFFQSIRDGHAPLCSPRVALDTCVASIKSLEAMYENKRVEIADSDYAI